MKQVRRTLPRLLRLLALTALVGTGAAQAQANDYAEITQLLKAGKAAEALTKAGTAIVKAQVRLPHGPIKAVGEFPIQIAAHTDVVVDVTIHVVPEAE